MLYQSPSQKGEELVIRYHEEQEWKNTGMKRNSQYLNQTKHESIKAPKACAKL